MERIRLKDSTRIHRNGASYHMSACRRAKTPVHEGLWAAMEPRLRALITCERAVEDAEDVRQQTLADVDGAEIDFENAIRDLDAELGAVDRADGSLNARRAVFPQGFSVELRPEGEAQLGMMTGLRKRLEPVQGFGGIPAVLARLDAAEAALQAAVAQDKQAVAAIEACELDEEAAKKAVREQLESAYGQLRAHYKSRPGMAERFFQRNPRGRKRVKAASKPA